VIFGGEAEGDVISNITDLYGSNSGDDTLTGDAGANLIDGYAGDDLISGGAGDDILRGRSGNDTAYGGDGDDVIHLGNESSAGDHDYAEGGAGADIFVFTSPGDYLTIGDFVHGEDVIDGADSFLADYASLVFTQVGDDVRIGIAVSMLQTDWHDAYIEDGVAYGITVKGTSVAAFTAADFSGVAASALADLVPDPQAYGLA
jgi:Ca2+-binding RTX toxin-like protein